MDQRRQDAALPRALVAEVLGVDEGALPPGDLPLDRLAARYLAFLAAGEDAPAPQPDGWTFVLVAHLIDTAPLTAFAVLRAALARAASPEEVAALAAGPLDDLVASQGPAVIEALEAAAAQAPRLAYALTGVQRPETVAPLLWARVEAARRGAPGLDEGAPLPPADGLV